MTKSSGSGGHYDLLVVGFGKGGKTLAMAQARGERKVALIERDPKMYGGSCINTACVPTKTLLSATVRGLDLPAAQKVRDALIGKLNAANIELVEDAGVTVVNGQARFVGPKEVRVSGDGFTDLGITADNVVINTGSVPVWPDLPGIDGARVHDPTTVQHLQPRPAHLVIIGGGPIGLEFATLFTGQGSKVTVIDAAEKPLGQFDDDIAEVARGLLEKAGVTFISGAQVERFDEDREGGRVIVTYGEGTVTADEALVAIGRRPATDGLGLEEAGIRLGERGEVLVDEHLRTNVEGVYAVGDVKGGPQFTYVSYDDYRIVLDQLEGRGERVTTGRLLPTTTFLEPPLSTIGLSEKEARESGRAVDVREQKVAEIPIVPRPKIVGQPEGVAKFLVDPQTNLILGATLFCVDSQELINTVAIAMRHGITARGLGEGIYIHPNSSEIFNALLA